MKWFIISLLLLASMAVNAEEEIDENLTPERIATMICGNQAHIVRQVQVIRQDLGHTYEEYEQNVRLMYVEDEGIVQFLEIGKFVYSVVPIETDLTLLFDASFEACMHGQYQMWLESEKPSF